LQATVSWVKKQNSQVVLSAEERKML
jgi:hypothetical protein